MQRGDICDLDRKLKKHAVPSQDDEEEMMSVRGHEDETPAQETSQESVFTKMQRNFLTLRGCPRELWLIFLLKLFESYANFSFALIITIYLTTEYGFSDLKAGMTYGIYGMLISVYGFFLGFAVDNLGVRKSLICGSGLLLISRLLIAVTVSPALTVMLMYTVLPMGCALGIPVMSLGIRRYTNDSNRSFAYSLFYVVMNVAALASGQLVDLLRALARRSLQQEMAEAAINVSSNMSNLTSNISSAIGPMIEPVCHLHNNTGKHLTVDQALNPYRLILISGAVVTGLMLFVAFFFVREINIDEAAQVKEFKPKTGTPLKIAKEILATSQFWKFLLLVVLLIGVRTVFRHLDATLPKYMLRSLGCGAPYGLTYSINPAMIIVSVPFIGAYTQGIRPFPMIQVGTFIAGASVFWMTLGSALVWDVLFVVTLSIGEAIYSPRLYEYTVTVAPLGREGTYAALCSAPYFVAKFAVGAFSGHILEKFCACVKSTCEACCTNTEGYCDGTKMWFLVGLTTISSPILITILSRWLEQAPSAKANVSEGDVEGEGAKE